MGKLDELFHHYNKIHKYFQSSHLVSDIMIAGGWEKSWNKALLTLVGKKRDYNDRNYDLPLNLTKSFLVLHGSLLFLQNKETFS